MLCHSIWYLSFYLTLLAFGNNYLTIIVLGPSSPKELELTIPSGAMNHFHQAALVWLVLSFWVANLALQVASAVAAAKSHCCTGHVGVQNSKVDNHK